MKTHATGFTRLELMSTITAVVLIGLCVAPLLGATRTASERAGCFNNMRRIGNAAFRWASDHGDQAPWWTEVNDGGTFFRGKPGNAWFEWATFSNELVTPVLLACPADADVRVATAFDVSATGLFNTGMRSSAISYMVGLHAQRDYPQAVLAMDRNVRFDSLSTVGCSTHIQNAHLLTTFFTKTRWTNAVHGQFGHVLLFDGRVEAAAWIRVTELFAEDPYAGGNKHFLKAR